MFGLGLPELIVIFLVILLLFGAKSLPDIARGIGEAVKIFKKEADGFTKDITESSDPKISSDKESKNSKESKEVKDKGSV